MPRIPYLPEDIAEPREIVDAVRKRRGGRLGELDRILLYSPALASGWNTMFGAIRNQFSLDARYRELAMCGVAILNRAEYEFFHHAPLLIHFDRVDARILPLKFVLPDGGGKCTVNLRQAVLQDAIEPQQDGEIEPADLEAVDQFLEIDKALGIAARMDK